MTNFRKINLPTNQSVKEQQKTVFKSFVGTTRIEVALKHPVDYENIIHIGKDVAYGDVFIAYNDNPTSFRIYFGKAGNEFKNNEE